MEAMDELLQLSESINQVASLRLQLSESINQVASLLDEDEENLTAFSSSSSSRRGSTFLNIVVLGNVGAGKSAVLNSLIGHPVLPTGENGATGAPISINLQRDRSLSDKSIFLQIDNESHQVSAGDLRYSLQEQLSKEGSSRGQLDEIYLNLRTSTAPPLKLIDLPGLDQRIVDDALIRGYIDDNDAILLVVVPASQVLEISSSRAVGLAKEFDAEGTRTIGVISKIDQAVAEQKTLSAVQTLLLNQGPMNTSDISWVALIGQSASIASAHSGSVGADNSLETAWRPESESLKSILTQAPPNKLGRLALVETLANKIRKRMKVRLQNLLSGLGKQMVTSAEGTRGIALEPCREFEDKFLQHTATGDSNQSMDMDMVTELPALILPTELPSTSYGSTDMPSTSYASTEQPSSRGSEESAISIVMLGDKGVGKSTILNMLIGHPLLPTGAIPTTTIPIVVDSKLDCKLAKDLIVCDSICVNASSVSANLRNILSKGKDSEFCFEIHTKTAPPLRLIDLPGVNKLTEDDLEDLMDKYVKVSKAILLIVIPASDLTHISSSRAVKVAKECDPAGTRTIFVISKLDIVGQDNDTLNLVGRILKDDEPCPNSVAVAFQQSNAVIPSLEDEERYLRTLLTEAPHKALGLRALVERIAELIHQKMKSRVAYFPHRFCRVPHSVAKAMDRSTVLNRVSRCLSMTDEYGSYFLLRSPSKISTFCKVHQHIVEEKANTFYMRRLTRDWLFERCQQMSEKPDEPCTKTCFAWKIYSLYLLIQQLLINDDYMSMQYVFYQKKHIFETKDSFCNILGIVVRTLGCRAHDVHIYSQSKGYAVGLSLTYMGRTVDCSEGGIIPPMIEFIEEVKIPMKTKFIIIVEKFTILEVLRKYNFHKRYNCVIITGRGMGDSSTRAFTNFLYRLFPHLFFMLSDHNPAGYRIYLVYKYGSAGSASENPNLNVPTLIHLGVKNADIGTHIACISSLIMTADDFDIAEQIKPDAMEDDIGPDLCLMLNRGLKCEIDQLSNKGGRYLDEYYLPLMLLNHEISVDAEVERMHSYYNVLSPVPLSQWNPNTDIPSGLKTGHPPCDLPGPIRRYKTYRKIRLPKHLVSEFLCYAADNTSKGLVTMGFLGGKTDCNGALVVKYVVIPEQRSSNCDVSCIDEIKRDSFFERKSLICLGRIRTHAFSESLLMSRMDLLHQLQHQMSIQEAISIHISPDGPSQFFRLTELGVDFLTRYTSSHDNLCSPNGYIYERCGHVTATMDMLKVKDFRVEDF